MDQMLLSLVTFLPIVGALAIAALPERLAKGGAMAVALLALAVSLPLWFGYDPANPAYQFEVNASWIETFGVRYHVGIDGVSLLLVLLTTALMPIIVAAGFSGVEKNHRAYYALMLALEGAMIGSFVALDTFLFYLFWEAVLIPMYFLVGLWGGENRIYAAVKLFLYTVAGSLLMLVAFIAVYAFAAKHGGWTTDLPELLKLDLPRSMQLWCFAAFALAFAIKVPMFPVHTWLPDAHVQAPTGGSVVLAGVMLKMGTYGFYRFAMPLFPEGAVAFGPVIIALSVIGIVYGALVAMVQDDVKKLVAYSSVSHMGFVMLGLFALNEPGASGAVVQMLNHGISTGALFLLVGIVYERRHTRRIVDYGGLAKVVPVFATFFMLVTFSSIGLPLLNGFVGEFMILLGGFKFAPIPTAVAATGVIFGAAYMLWMFQRVMFGPLTNRENAALTDMNGREIAYMAPLALAIVVLGVYPQPLLDRINPSVDRFLARVHVAWEGSSPYADVSGAPSWLSARAPGVSADQVAAFGVVLPASVGGGTAASAACDVHVLWSANGHALVAGARKDLPMNWAGLVSPSGKASNPSAHRAWGIETPLAERILGLGSAAGDVRQSLARAIGGAGSDLRACLFMDARTSYGEAVSVLDALGEQKLTPDMLAVSSGESMGMVRIDVPEMTSNPPPVAAEVALVQTSSGWQAAGATGGAETFESLADADFAARLCRRENAGSVVVTPMVTSTWEQVVGAIQHVAQAACVRDVTLAFDAAAHRAASAGATPAHGEAPAHGTGDGHGHGAAPAHGEAPKSPETAPAHAPENHG